MLLTVHVLVDLAKRRRESTGSYPDGRGNDRSVHTAGALRGNLAFGGHISTRTVIRRLRHQGMRARRPTYSQRKNNPRQLHPHPQEQLCPKCGYPEMKCFVGAKPLHDRR
jgi:hypothetical protein